LEATAARETGDKWPFVGHGHPQGKRVMSVEKSGEADAEHAAMESAKVTVILRSP